MHSAISKQLFYHYSDSLKNFEYVCTYMYVLSPVNAKCENTNN